MALGTPKVLRMGMDRHVTFVMSNARVISGTKYACHSSASMTPPFTPVPSYGSVHPICCCGTSTSLLALCAGRAMVTPGADQVDS